MNPLSIFYNRETKLLRSGWRALIFAALLNAPMLLLSSISARTESSGDNVFDVSFAMIATYALIILWTGFISWLCLRFLDRLPISSLGYDFRPGWWREALRGIAMASTMIAAVDDLLERAGHNQQR